MNKITTGSIFILSTTDALYCICIRENTSHECITFFDQDIWCSVMLTLQKSRPNTVKPLVSGLSWGWDNWPLNRGGCLIEVHPKTMLGVVQFSVYQWRKSRTMMVITRSITSTKAKETITCMCTDVTCLSTQHWLVCCRNKLKCVETLFWDFFNQILLKMCFYSIPHCHSFTFIWLKMSNFKSSWSLKRSTKQNKITLGRARSWLRPLNTCRGDRWVKVFITVYSWQFFRDFGCWPRKKGWPLNGGLLNRGSTVRSERPKGFLSAFMALGKPMVLFCTWIFCVHRLLQLGIWHSGRLVMWKWLRSKLSIYMFVSCHSPYWMGK